MFLETSAYTGEGVQEVFLKCARTILTKIETGFFFCLFSYNNFLFLKNNQTKIKRGFGS